MNGRIVGAVGVSADITQEKRIEERLEILHEIDRLILAARAPADIAQAAIDKVLRATGALRVAAAIYDLDDQCAEILATTGLNSAQPAVGSRWPLSAGWLIDKLRAGRVATVADMADLPDTDKFKAARLEQGIRSALLIPMIAGEQVIGQLTVHRAQPGRFPDDVVDLATHVADSLAIAIRNAQQDQELGIRQAALLQANWALTASREQLQNLSHRLVRLQESERSYVANELYNDEGQRLSALLIGLSMLEREPGVQPDQAGRIAELKQLGAGILADMHDLAVNLLPATLDHLGLAAALGQYGRELGRSHGLAFGNDLTCLQELELPRETETILYRIAEEALANAVRYARATQLAIVAARRDGRLILIVEDDGQGFDVAESERSGRLGLLGMRERAEMLGGALTIESVQGQGTTVFVDVPVTQVLSSAMAEG